MAGTWHALTNDAPASINSTFLLTDGCVLAQGASTNKWYKLTPDSTGSYRDGSWSTLADSVKGPLYYASGILRDGRFVYAGGEYNNGALIEMDFAEIYNPVNNTWTTLPTPAGWTQIGDAPGVVLPDGRFYIGRLGTKNTAVYDPVANTWTAGPDKLHNVTEESWSLMPDGTVLSVDCSGAPAAEKYVIAADQWVAAGSTPQGLVDSITEIGASVLLPDGRLLAIGATGHTAIYTMPPVANQAGTWTSGPNIPQVNAGEALGAVDAPAAVLPNGKVLTCASPITTPATFQSPTYFFEFDPSNDTFTTTPRPTNDDSACYNGRMLVLPNGEVLWTYGRAAVEIYTPDGTIDDAWRPAITNSPTSVQAGASYTLKGRQLNGLTQCVYYGDDATQATNYPIVRFESQSSSAVTYARTFDFSSMGLQTGTVVHSCQFKVPSGVAVGNYRLVVIANGIPSYSKAIQVSHKIWKELKLEIKEKAEIIEKLVRDDYSQKRVFEHLGKEVREEIDFHIHEEDWVESVKIVATEIDAMQAELRRAFVKPTERPALGATRAKVERIVARKARPTEVKELSEKKAYNDGTPEKPVPDEFVPIEGHLPHWDQYEERLKADRGRPTKATAKKVAAKKVTAKKVAAKKVAAKKATRATKKTSKG